MRIHRNHQIKKTVSICRSLWVDAFFVIIAVEWENMKNNTFVFIPIDYFHAIATDFLMFCPCPIRFNVIHFYLYDVQFR